MFTISGIKLLFITAGIVFCVWFSTSIKNDSKRQETAAELRKKIRNKADKLYQGNSKPED